MAEGTPMMLQYHKIKADHPDCILFFRLGDFYEMFNEDAKTASRELELTLTSRDRTRPPEERTPMCGVPYHAAEAYISRLIAKGYKVAICEQMEDPAQAKGLVDRDIIRIVTPGTVIEETMLEEGKNNFLCALCLTGDRAGLCFADLSTGEVSATGFDGSGWREHVENELGRYSPREVVLSREAVEDKALGIFLEQRLSCRTETGSTAAFDPDRAAAAVEKQFGPDHGLPEGPVFQAAGALMSYLVETQKTDLSHLSTVNYYTTGEFMELDLTARRNLELTETLRGGEKKGSLLWVLDKTGTPMGHRLIRSWLERPLLSPVQIGKRQGAVGDLVNDSVTRQELSRELKEVTDLERLIGRVVYGTAGGRDLVSLSRGLGKLPALRLLLSPFSSALLTVLRDSLDDLPQLRGLIDETFVEEPPFSVREGGFIRPGADPEVDRLRGILTGGKDMVAAMEAQEKEKTGIKSLKVGYNKVFGYYIEVSKANSALVPDAYIRKQTLVNCERYITPELKEMENTILSAQDQLTALEYQIFCRVRQAAAERVADIQRSAAAVGQVDVLCSFARVAAENGYCMPRVDLSDVIEITEGRHPVVEKAAKGSLFVPNDTYMDGKGDLCAIITGPNMAGKSTYMRQVALIVLMAQMGSFVPAKAAHIGVVDRVFTRIGASDDLSAGQSTFMVEMNEVAELLKNATGKSLLILDEIGRGTSTYDGMAIARAVLEYCADSKRLGAKTLFATHYHELTALEGEIPGVKNYNIAAKKRQDDIIFLRKIVRGGAEASYGIEVAKLAGVPERVISRAKVILGELESTPAARATAPTAHSPAAQVSLEEVTAQGVAARLRAVDIDTLTPIEAMNLVYQLKKEL
ncbi:MAG: DNA mismatch repair protein MutS [Oscillospiraceae bacterium]|jgi:DNA mismatch repair protein MutS|nr:DNA mismatch repair protein MutS [Oscillospiraceae bacterium]